jgi:hypothetical protein
MINSTDDYIANASDTFVISPIYSQNKTNKLNITRNKNKITDFWYNYGILIVIALYIV